MTTTDFLLSPNQFVCGDQEAAEILQWSPTAASTQGRTWSNSWIDIDELSLYARGFFLTIGSYVVHALCMTDFSKRLWVESRHLFNDAQAMKVQQVFQDKLLVKSVNTHRLNDAEYFTRPPASTSLSTHPTPNLLQFFHRDGICRGSCHWFVQLYFKTVGRMPDAERHLVAVGAQFAEGAPRQAAFLHALGLSSLSDLLHINTQADFVKISPEEKTEDQIVQEFQAQPPGVYGIYTSTHQVVYVKTPAQHYLFDPNVGVVKVDSPLLFKSAMQRYFASHDPSQEIVVDMYSSR